jgi:hypothetical protein
VNGVRYTLKHAAMLALGLVLGIGTMAFTDILHPISSFIPNSMILNSTDSLPETMGWVDPRYRFDTDNATGVLEIRWYCFYEGMNTLGEHEADTEKFNPGFLVQRPELPQDQDEEDFYFELTRTQFDPCPVFRYNHEYPEK